MTDEPKEKKDELTEEELVIRDWLESLDSVKPLCKQTLAFMSSKKTPL